MKILVKDYKLKRQTAERTYKDKLKNNKNLLNEMNVNEEMEYNEMDNIDEDSSLVNTFNKILNIGHRNGDKCTLFDH